MPFITTKGEKSVDDLMDRAYNRLTDKQRTTERTALLRANPQLAEIERLPPGTIIEVPARTAPRTKVSRKADDPDGEVLQDIDRALSSFTKEYQTGHEASLSELKEALKLAKSKSLVNVVGKDQDLKDVHATALRELEEQRKLQEAKKTAFDQIAKTARSDIKKRL